MRMKRPLAPFAKLIYSEVEISRSKLAEMAKLAPSFVTVLVRRLRDKGMLLESSHASSGRGRRKGLLRFDPELAHLIGLKIGRANSRIVITDFVGTVLSSAALASQVSRGEAHVLSSIYTEIDRALQEHPGSRGIGVAHSGVIDPLTGTVLSWPRVPGWKNLPLEEMLAQKYGLPTLVRDSAGTMAIAEKYFGKGKG